jgi:transketolase
MRKEFISGLTELAAADARIVLITADLGWGVLEPFGAKFPSRFFNVGVTEQAMVGVATGLAARGLIPYCYTIATFAVARTFEFLRNGPVAHGLPVRLVGVGPGFEYSHDGFTHYALEDVGLLANQPGVTIVAPRDSASAGVFGSSGFSEDGLVYIRLSKNTSSEPILMQNVVDVVGSVEPDDVLIIFFGDAVARCREVCDELRTRGVDPVPAFLEVLDSTLDSLALQVVASRVRRVLVVENHYVRGGVGSLLTDLLASAGWSGRIWKWGIENFPGSDTGTLEGMMRRHMTAPMAVCESIATNVLS